MIQYSTVQYSTVQYSTEQYSALHYSTVQCSYLYNIMVQQNVVFISLSPLLLWEACCEGKKEGVTIESLSTNINTITGVQLHCS